MHQLSTAFVLGYHGCDRRVAEALIAGGNFLPSENDYDWLGSGVYFWESNPLRGLEFAREVTERKQQKTGTLEDADVVGAVIDLGFCLDLISSNGLKKIKAVYEDFKSYNRSSGRPLPKNLGGSDLLLRKLDCAVINHLHEIRKTGGLPAFDSVRGVFLEGTPIYPGAGFFEKTHIQICVRNPDCIKGVFRVPQAHLDL
ncbi:MAG: hypothetical protein GVY13_07370 [Alphaproteobacteria bacterium]|nr:hypothetical protein [Alphaproteobacteria bacterium]